MFSIVCLSFWVSASSRYCADSACARITASECPTTSCTSRARRAWSSRSRAISRDCSAATSARAAPSSAATCEAFDSVARSRNRMVRPASHGTSSTAIPVSPTRTAHETLPTTAALSCPTSSTNELSRALSSAARFR